MPGKKTSQNGHTTARVPKIEVILAEGIGIGSPKQPRPYRINPETKEQREKRLAKRKALTLKAFQGAYHTHKQK